MLATLPGFFFNHETNMTYVSPTIKELDFEWASVVPLSQN
jgi:hypothetical protein